MGVLRVILFSGLVFHKLVWEVLKRRESVPAVRPRPETSAAKSFVKAAKTAVLVFIIIQTLFLDLLPISDKPTGLRVVGTLIFLVGLATAVSGRVQLGENWANIEDYQILQEQSLVTDGVYRYVRHPIYAGDVLLLIGLELALNSWFVLGVIIPALVVVRNVMREEAILSQSFPGYETYRRQTKRFIPFIL